MRRFFYIVFILAFCSSFHSASAVGQQGELGDLIKELTYLKPLQRVIRTSRYVDSLSEAKSSLSMVRQRLDILQMKAAQWDDQVLQKHLNFYQIVKKGFQPITPNEIIAVFDSARKYFEKQSDDRYAGVCHYYIGYQRYNQKQYGEAFYHHAKVQELFEKVGIQNVPEIGKYLHVIAINHLYFHDYKKVVQLMLAAINQPAYNRNLDVQRYNTLAVAYQNLDKLDSAIFYFRRTRDVAISLGNTTWPHIAIGNLGRVYLKQGLYHEAVNLLMQDYRHSQYHEGHPVLARNAAVEIAVAWQKLGRQDSILHYLRESERLNAAVRNGEPMWKQQRDEEFYITYYKVFHDYFKTEDNMPMAYRYLDSLTHLSNETNLRYNRMTAQVAEDSLKIQEYLADMAIQQTEKNYMSARLQFVIGVVGLLAIIMGLLYYLLRIRHAKDRLITEKEKIIQESVQEKMKAQLAEANLELQEYMRHLQEKNNLVEAFQIQINELHNLPVLKTQQLDELANRLAHTKLLTVDDWNDFRQRFNKAFGGELDQLKMNYGDLTTSEERLYALEKMNVSTAQIAWMLGISPESVRKSRYRLRKKIGFKDI